VAAGAIGCSPLTGWDAAKLAVDTDMAAGLTSRDPSKTPAGTAVAAPRFTNAFVATVLVAAGSRT
jgi:hypothetical protein